MHSRRSSLLMFAVLAAAACAKDPTAGKTRAEVGAARAETPVAQGGEQLAITPAGSAVGFVGAKVTAQHIGHFSDFGGTISLVDGDPARSRVEIAVKTASISIEGGPAKLEKHLRSPDFFDVEKYPDARFVSTEIKRDGAGWQVTGNLSLRGVEKSVTFPATIDVTRRAVTVKAEFGVNRKDFGIVYPGMQDDLIKDNVLIQISLQAPRKTEGA